MDPLLMEIISWLVILMHHTCLDLLSILRLSYAHNKKSDSSWSRTAERHASWRALRSSATGCPGTTCRRAHSFAPPPFDRFASSPLLYHRAWLMRLLPPHTIYLYYTRKV